MRLAELRIRLAVFCSVALFAVATGGFCDEEKPQQRIRAAYAKSATALRYKYLEGALSIRAPEYIGYGLDGKRIDLRIERSNMQKMITPALAVSETSEISSFTNKGPKFFTCRVHDTLHFILPQPRPRPPVDFIVTSDSLDEWQLIGNAWKQTANHLQKQTTDTKPYILGENAAKKKTAP